MSEKSKVIKIDGQELAGKAAELREAGITGVIVRLDTLNHTRYHDISEGKSLQTVIDGINGAIDQQLAVRLDVAITEGFNDDEVLDFLQLTLQHRCDIVFLPTIDYGILKEKNARSQEDRRGFWRSGDVQIPYGCRSHRIHQGLGE